LYGNVYPEQGAGCVRNGAGNLFWYSRVGTGLCPGGKHTPQQSAKERDEGVFMMVIFHIFKG
jgi:hypothetical protein